MEKKTLAEIMAEPATVEAIIKKAMEINDLLLKVENMPELEGLIKVETVDVRCDGCFYNDTHSPGAICHSPRKPAGCLRGGHSFIFVKRGNHE